MLVGAALILLLYKDTFNSWWEEWTVTGSFYAHAMFVPFFVAIMVWQNRARIDRTRWKPSWYGAGALAFGMLLFLAGQRLDVVAVKSISFMFVLLGASLMLLGAPRTRVLIFPIAFVVMMMPLIPDQIINGIAFPIQLKSAQLATVMLNVIQLHAVCLGTMIKMDTYSMAVELPCSGFKTLVSLMTFTAAFSYLVEGEKWKRWTLFITTIPLSLFVNALRIAFVGIVGELISKQAAAVFHDYSGFIVLTLAFLFLFNFARVLRCSRFLGVPLTDEEEARDREEAAKRAGADPEPGWWQELMTWRPETKKLRAVTPFIVAFDLIVGITLAARAPVTHPLHVQPPIATFQVPNEFTYDGVKYTCLTNAQDPQVDRLPKDEAEALSPTRVVMRLYQGSDGSVTQFFMTSGSGRKTFHDPHSCMLGSNAELTDVGTPDITTPIGRVRVQESTYVMKGQSENNRMMFCYVVEGNLLQNKYQIRNAIMRQMILGDAGRPSYFLRFLPQTQGLDDIKRNQLTHFIAGIWTQIGPILVGQKPGLPDPSPILLTPERK
jgi:exosortase